MQNDAVTQSLTKRHVYHNRIDIIRRTGSVISFPVLSKKFMLFVDR